MLIYDEPLLSGQPPLSGHSPVPRGWPLNGGCFFLDIIYLTYFWSSPPPRPLRQQIACSLSLCGWLWTKETPPNKKKRQQQQQNNNKNRITRIPFNFTLLNWTLHRPSPSQHRHTPAPPLLTTLIAVPLDNPLIFRSWCSKLTNSIIYSRSLSKRSDRKPWLHAWKIVKRWELFKIAPSKIATLQVKAMENLSDSRIWYFCAWKSSQ